MDDAGHEKDVSGVPKGGQSEEEAVQARIDAMLGKVEAARSRTVDHGFDSSHEKRLSDLEDRARQGRAHYSKGTHHSSDANMGTAIGFAVAYNLAGCVIGGWLFGLLIDQTLTHTFWGQVIGIIVGGLAGLTSAVLLILKKGGDKSK